MVEKIIFCLVCIQFGTIISIKQENLKKIHILIHFEIVVVQQHHAGRDIEVKYKKMEKFDCSILLMNNIVKLDTYNIITT